MDERDVIAGLDEEEQKRLEKIAKLDANQKRKKVIFGAVTVALIAMFFANFQDNPVVESIFRGIRPAVVALIAAPTFNLARSAKISLANCWIPIAGALAIWLMKVNPVVIILIAGLGGYLYGKLVKPTER